ncbi:MAG: NAD(+) synthase [Oscillospiraceae bacterium]|nr:NAD(+) synthase [Oscillospiraceae bacterium]MBQ9149125.1 NAD(+) synthase [Oscillospiraceae bacterium]
MLDYIRIACAVPPVRVGDVTKNVEDICARIKEADTQNVDLVVFPELALTGYTCADLFFQDTLLEACRQGLARIVECSVDHPDVTVVVGLPALVRGQMYNCGAVLSAGKVHGLVPKTYLPNYNEFYERRWFSSSEDLTQTHVDSKYLGLTETYEVPIGRDLLFRMGDGTILGVEICEDLWTPVPPSTFMTINGAEVVVNLSASNETVGKRDYRRRLVQHQSSICSCVYAYTSSGCTESTQDLVFSGHSLIAEDGALLAENQQLIETDYLLVADADLGRIRGVRRKNKSVKDATSFYGKMEPMRHIDTKCDPLRSDGVLYPLEKLPFVPSARADRLDRCMAIFQIQVAGLKQRLATIGNVNAVIGVSGGLDSTLALLVAVEAMRQLGRPASDVYGVTMPCFGTSDRTYQNSWKLMETLGITAKEISIKAAVTQHFADIGHDPTVFNGTYENAQARERTQILMDYSSVVGGIVIGTGDLSELALGWCTYNGDQMSMYGVNASIPKTLIRWMIDAISESDQFAASREVLKDILDTPISPELLPPDEKGQIAQYTEDLVGPYALHDFFLYHMMRFGYSPAKIYTLACRAFRDDFEAATVKKWLKAFYRRFFTQQFKRSCMPDGVKVGNISLSPRGDWRMPSDASGRIWLDEIEKL